MRLNFAGFKDPEGLISALAAEVPEAILFMDAQAKNHINQIALSYQLSKEDIEELRMDCLVIFIQKIKKGEYVYQGFEPLTYLLNIAKLQVRNYCRKKQRHEVDSIDDFDFEVEYEDTISEESEQVELLLTKLGEPCANIIRLKYLEGLKDAEVIGKQLASYSSIDSLKNQRARCMKKLIEIASIFKNSK